MSNSFGRLFRLTSFGESHGLALGGVLDGVPAGLVIDEGYVQAELDARRPGQEGQSSATSRKEPDRVEFLSGIFEGRSTGCPIAFIIRNTSQKSGDYEHLKNLYRPGHADYSYTSKYTFRDYRGGGRSSGRETVSRVVGGAIAALFLKQYGIELAAYTEEFGGIVAVLPNDFSPFTDSQSKPCPFFAPDMKTVELWEGAVKEAKQNCDSLGGVVRLLVRGLPAGLGGPVFDKLDARLASAMFGVGTVKGVELGAGFSAARMRGSENNDQMFPGEEAGSISFASNHAGGVLGGMSTGQELDLRVALKPIASIAREQSTVTCAGAATTLKVGGRHDVSVIPRVVPVLKAMLALTLADFLLLSRCDRIE